jgi:hypothetical protein
MAGMLRIPCAGYDGLREAQPFERVQTEAEEMDLAS